MSSYSENYTTTKRIDIKETPTLETGFDSNGHSLSIKLKRKASEIFWDKDKKPFSTLGVAAIPLASLSFLYGIGVSLRVSRYKRDASLVRNLDAPVISIGNLTVGGSGKTPLTKFLTEFILSTGRTPAILSRGYGGKQESTPKVVGDGRDVLSNAKEVGDEPCMLARILKGAPIIAAPERIVAGNLANARFAPDCFILDDAYQHLSLFRDLNILVIDGNRGFGNGNLLPLGPLREPLRGMKRADLIFINHSDNTSDKTRVEIDFLTKKYCPTAPIVEGKMVPSKFKILKDAHNGYESLSLKEFDGQKAILFSGIGNPISFETSVKSIGIDVIEHLIFPDHYYYTERDILKIIQTANNLEDCVLITTAKDAERLYCGEIRNLVKNTPNIKKLILESDIQITKNKQILERYVEKCISSYSKSV